MKKLKPCPFCGGSAKFENSFHVEPVIDENGAYIDGDLKTSEMIDSYELQVGEIKTDSEIYNELTELFSKHGANQSNTTINFPRHAASLIEMFRYYGYDTTKF